MGVDLYVEGGNRPINSTLCLSSHLEDLRVSNERCYDIFQAVSQVQARKEFKEKELLRPPQTWRDIVDEMDLSKLENDI